MPAEAPVASEGGPYFSRRGQKLRDVAQDTWPEGSTLASSDCRAFSIEVADRRSVEPTARDQKVRSPDATLTSRCNAPDDSLIRGNRLEQLFELNQLGVRIAVDDFGTGESAIVYLKRFPIDVLKIDRSYIRGMVDNEQDADLASAMVAMGHHLRLSVVAEGVELESQVERLRNLECDELQGFLFSPAVPAEEFGVLLGRQGRKP